MGFFILLNFKKGSKRKFAFLGVMAILAIISYFYYFQVSAFEAFSLRLQTVKQMQSGEEGSAAGCVIFWQDQIENAFESPLIGKVFNLRSLCISEFFIAYFIASLITAEIYLPGSIFISLISIVTVKANDINCSFGEKELVSENE